ncbi:prepilin-type N-terminal cleavage/methylation domain-containing protein [Streptomyces sp. NPDC090077]|uniref:type IV pilus modification PilV family protein n=1 Tax=Streptomyces sp. NPDC090077 TaxID=3365938 RepID=UPI00380DD66A
MTAQRPSGRPESGFTLTELLVAIVILGVIAVVLPQAITLGLRFTADTGKRVAATSALGALGRHFYGDVQSAEEVTTGPACGVADVIVRLGRPGTDVVYAYDRPTGSLNRVTCTGGTVVSTSLGRFDDPTPAGPVTLTCGAGTPCTSPMEVTLTVRSDPAAPPTTLTAVRRASAS